MNIFKLKGTIKHMTDVARLYDYFKPTRYELSLTPNMSTLTFTGKVTITGKLEPNQRHLRLHSKALNINKAKIGNVAREFELKADQDELLISLNNQDSGEITVSVEFDGVITKAMHGIYPCYTRKDEIILATQFESHHAREAFPCIDEPEAKAVFSLSLTTLTGEAVLANTEPAKTTAGKKLTTTLFEDTPKMSTYLLAFATGPLHCVSGKTVNGTDVRIWASNDHADETLTFALDTAIKVTEFYNDYFDTPYPLTKSDHIALPDFSSGAMENWGLITYREVCLIVDPATTSTNTKEYAAMVIAHELSHQWFGNLVTMQWWNDLWLNESFASLMEYIAIDALYPQWKLMLNFASQEALSAFWRDSISGVQAVQCEVNHPDQISTLFDPSIVYAKGSRLLLMVHNFVGEDDFKKGLRLYFKRHAYGNTVGNDLWQALQDASGKDVKTFMNDWLSKPGFPLVKVNQKDSELKLSQIRFTNSTSANKPSNWPIPLGIRPKQSFELFDKPTATYKLNTSEFIRLNHDGGHYSVRYTTAKHRNYLKKQIEDGVFSPSERLLFLNDSLMQARAGQGSIAETMDVLDALKHETEDSVWDVMSLCMSDARTLVDSNKKAEAKMKKFAWQLTKELYGKYGWAKQADEDINTTKLRGTILGLAVYSENKLAIKDALDEYAKYSSIEQMPADTRHIILTAAVRHGDTKVFNDLLEIYPSITNSELQQDVCSALTSTKKLANTKILIDKIKDSKFVRLQDVDRWIVYLLRNRKSRVNTWNWLVKNWPWIEQNFGTDKSYDNYPRFAGRIFSTEKWLQKYNAFFEPMKSTISLKRNIEIGTEEIKNRIAWRKRDEQALVDWLENR